ncbi:hypothetical protein BSKO_13929 [Bryopsis sp. KO-2023]|nr:hypothetical protein BSKO_13929 [Bryopsis sp. KO-2023]
MAPTTPPKTSPENIKVVVRCRPLNSKEINDGRQRIVEMETNTGQVQLRNPKLDASDPSKMFTFDSVFDWNSQQQAIFDECARPIVDSVMEGYNGTIFAYGQTGTGKTHTMEGVPGDQQGIIPNTFNHIFEKIEVSENMQYLVRASFLEIYNEEIRDLLSREPKNKLHLKESKDNGVYVKGLNAFVVKSVPEIMNVLEVGKKNRSVGATAMNQDSSRSHSIFTITIETVEQGAGKDGHIRVGKLNLVDLAGSERQSKTGATGERLKEATKINLSLSALGNVISALVDGKSGHVPYRDSKLTRLLQDSLGGNTKTVMVANMGPADWNYDETLSTLRYANRAKNIQNKPRINEDPKDAMLKEFQNEIERLKAALEEAEDVPDGEVKERVVERVIKKEKSMKASDIEKLKKDMEMSMRQELAGKGVELGSEEYEQIRRDAEAQAILKAKQLEEAKREAESEAAKINEDLHEKQELALKRKQEAEQESSRQQALREKLIAMQDKVLMGEAKGGLLGVAQEKEAELKAKKEVLEKRRREEALKAQKIADMEEAHLAAEGKYSSLQEETDIKTKKIKKLMRKVKGVSQEIEDRYAEFQAEKENLLDCLRMLQRQMQLKTLVIEAFIPPEEVAKVMRRARWEEEREIWVLERSADSLSKDKNENAGGNQGGMKRPMSAAGQRRPISAFAKMVMAIGEMNPRFKSDNILNLELDMPERTTYDYEGMGMDERVQDALNAAFADDPEALLLGPSCHTNVFLAGGETQQRVTESQERRPSSGRRRPSSARRSSRHGR